MPLREEFERNGKWLFRWRSYLPVLIYALVFAALARASWWASETPAFIPKPYRWRRSELPFSMRTVLRREYSAVFAIGASFAVIDIVENFVVGGELRLDPLEAGVFGVAAVCYAVLLSVKRRTRLLHVDGR